MDLAFIQENLICRPWSVLTGLANNMLLDQHAVILHVIQKPIPTIMLNMQSSISCYFAIPVDQVWQSLTISKED